MACDLGKICYAKGELAEKLKSLRSKRGHARSYWCPDCAAYHLTTKQKSKPYDRSKEKQKRRRKQREEYYC